MSAAMATASASAREAPASLEKLDGDDSAPKTLSTEDQKRMKRLRQKEKKKAQKANGIDAEGAGNGHEGVPDGDDIAPVEPSSSRDAASRAPRKAGSKDVADVAPVNRDGSARRKKDDVAASNGTAPRVGAAPDSKNGPVAPAEASPGKRGRGERAANGNSGAGKPEGGNSTNGNAEIKSATGKSEGDKTPNGRSGGEKAAKGTAGESKSAGDRSRNGANGNGDARGKTARTATESAADKGGVASEVKAPPPQSARKPSKGKEGAPSPAVAESAKAVSGASERADAAAKVSAKKKTEGDGKPAADEQVDVAASAESAKGTEKTENAKSDKTSSAEAKAASKGKKKGAPQTGLEALEAMRLVEEEKRRAEKRLEIERKVAEYKRLQKEKEDAAEQERLAKTRPRFSRMTFTDQPNYSTIHIYHNNVSPDMVQVSYGPDAVDVGIAEAGWSDRFLAPGRIASDRCKVNVLSKTIEIKLWKERAETWEHPLSLSAARGTYASDGAPANGDDDDDDILPAGGSAPRPPSRVVAHDPAQPRVVKEGEFPQPDFVRAPVCQNFSADDRTHVVRAVVGDKAWVRMSDELVEVRYVRPGDATGAVCGWDFVPNGNIVPSESAHVTADGVLTLTLRKATPGKWSTLEGTRRHAIPLPPIPSGNGGNSSAAGSSSHADAHELTGADVVASSSAAGASRSSTFNADDDDDDGMSFFSDRKRKGKLSFGDWPVPENHAPTGLQGLFSTLEDEPRSSFSVSDTLRRFPASRASVELEPEEEDVKPAENPVVPPGCCGLRNLGKTCFMNSILQCLSHTEDLRRFFLEGKYRGDVNPKNPLGMGGQLAESFANLLRKLWSGRAPSESPASLKQMIGQKAKMFMGYQQHDSQEFMAFLMDGLHEDVNRIVDKPYVETAEQREGESLEELSARAWANHLRRNDSIIVDTFQGQFRSTLRCPDCNKVSVTFDPFMYLSLPLAPKKDRRIEVTFVPMPRPDSDAPVRPTQYAVRVASHETIGHLRKTVSEAVGVPLERLVLAEVYMSKILANRPYADKDEVGDIRAGDKVFAFEALAPIAPLARRPSSVIRTGSLPDIDMQPETPSGPASVPMHLRLVDYDVPDQCATCFAREGSPAVATPDAGASSSETPALFDGVEESAPSAAGASSSDAPAPRTSGDGEPETVAAASTETVKLEPCDVCLSVAYCSAACRAEHASAHRLDCRRPSVSKAFGVPALLSFDSHLPTIRAIRRAVLASLRFYLSTPLSEGDPLPFSIVAEDGHNLADPSIDENDAYDVSKCRAIYIDFTKGTLAAHYRADSENEFATDASMSSCEPEGAAVRLERCLQMFTEPETLSPEEAWYCPSCKTHREATKTMSLWRLPRVLVIHLKRFSFSRYRREKLSTEVEFPLRGLDLSSYIPPNADRTTAPVYDLFAVSNHFGSAWGGHYTAAALHSRLNAWYNYDDSSAYRTARPGPSSSSAYVLFYRLRDETSPYQSEPEADPVAEDDVPRYGSSYSFRRI
eukprot:Opistho-1_new@70791